MQFKAVFPNRDQKLWPGQYVNTRIVLGTRQKAVTVAASVVQRGPNGLFAYVVNAEETVYNIHTPNAATQSTHSCYKICQQGKH